MSQLTAAPPQQEISPARRRRRWLLWLGMPVLLLALWFVLAVLFFLYQTDRDLREAMTDAERDSPGGWQLDDIEARREPIADEDNAALVVLKVKSLLPANWGAATESMHARLVDLPPEVALNESLLRALRDNLAQAEPARVEARKLIGMTRGRFPIDWDEIIFNTKLHSQEARAAANLLRYEAALASQEAHADAALARVRGLVGTARSVGDEPFLLSALIRLACDAQAVDALERTLAQGEPSAAELKAVQVLLEQEAAEPMLVRALRGERAGLQKMLLSLRSRGTSIADLLDQSTASRSAGIERKLLVASGPTLVRRSHPRMLQLLNEYVQASQLPFEEQPRAMDKLDRKVRRARVDYDIVTGLLMPALQKVAEAYRRGIGNLRCAYVAVALERYRQDHGRWPQTLDALVPRYLAAVPADPQDGKPLRFKCRPNGVVVYWIGQDGIDDGGKIDRFHYLATGFDQGVQLWDTKDRRQPARELLLLRPREVP
jgi:hypothetical protein